jgi:acyl carrier protein
MAWIFGDFRLDPERFELSCGAELVRLEPQVLALLCLLVRHHDRMVTKDEIVDAVKDIIATIAPDEELDGLDMNERLRDQIELDSMDFLDIVMELRKRYGVQVPEEDYPHLNTLGGCAEYLGPRMADKELKLVNA